MLKTVRKRTKFVAGMFALAFFVIVLRVAWLQIVVADDLMEKATEMWDSNREIPAKRGTIYDRNGRELAMDVAAYTVAVNPREIVQKNAAGPVVAKLAPVLGISKEKLHRFVTKKGKDGTYLAQVEVRNEGWKISKEKADRVKKVIEELRTTFDDRYFNGVLLLDDIRRFYPNNQMAAHILGYYDKAGKAVGGIESQFDKYLRGKPGTVEYKRFADNRYKNTGKVKLVPEQNGKSIQLTIDTEIQMIIEQALDDTYENFKPKSISVIAADPKTMEILGMSNRPSFNPNAYWETKNMGDFYNHAISSTYEPGSTFKVITWAAATEEKVFNKAGTYQSGSIKVGGRTIRDHNRKGWGEITFLDGLIRSSNVGFVNLGYLMLGPNRMKEHIHQFGFTKKTGIELPKEEAGSANLIHDSDYAALTYGQGKITVTPIQQAVALGSLANGGKMMKPMIIKKVKDFEGIQTLKTYDPLMIGRTVSEQTAKTVITDLEHVITDQKWGTGKRAKSDFYRLAGKTGTANKVIGRGYAPGKWVLSFVGVAPVEDPKVVLIIVADEPDLEGVSSRGGSLTPPLFKRLSEEIMEYMKVPYEKPVVTDKSLESINVKTVAPDLNGISSGQLVEITKRFQLRPVVFGKGTKVLQQFPKNGSPMLIGDHIFIKTDTSDKIEMPDLTGFSLREVKQVCALFDLHCRTEGKGYVTKQQVIELDGKKINVFNFMPLSHLAKVEAEKEAKKNQAMNQNENSAQPANEIAHPESP